MFTLPMIAGNIVQQLYNTVDSLIVGRVIGPSALAAVGVSHPVMILLVSLLIGLGTGADILTARYHGAGDLKQVKQVIESFLSLVLILSVLTGLLGAAVTVPILRLIHTPPDIMEGATQYLRVIFLGLFTLAGYNTLGGVLRGTGDSMTPLLYLVLAAVINILLDILFVVVLRIGIIGAAYATVIAQGLSFAACLLHINRNKRLLPVLLLKPEWRIDLICEGLRIGFPAAIQRIISSIGMLVVQSLVNPFGMVSVAAHTAGMRVDSFAALPVMDLSYGITIFSSQNLAAGKKNRVFRGYRDTLFLGWTFCICLTIFMWFAGGHVIALFTDNKMVQTLGHRYLRILCPSYLIACYMHVTLGIIKGSGNTLVSMLISLFSLWIIRLPAAELFKPLLGISGIWLSVPVSWTAGGIAAGLYYHRWRKSILMTEGE
jgi:MATE family, multidrug efflux pump